MRKKEQTLPEGSRLASASHSTLPACATGTGGRSVPVPVEGPMQKARTAEECCVHSFCATGLAQRHRRCEVGGRARRRSVCVRGHPVRAHLALGASWPCRLQWRTSCCRWRRADQGWRPALVPLAGTTFALGLPRCSRVPSNNLAHGSPVRATLSLSRL